VTATKLIPSLGVSDIERSLGFYRLFFGFEVADSYEQEGRMAWCWLRAGGADLMLQQLTADQQIRLNPAIGQSWVIYLRVDDIEALHTRLERGGFPASAIQPTSYGTREFFVPDPDGYELWISVPDEAAAEPDTDEHDADDA
jgi:uncharacterized glyoxalase superfamily protein PhnB